MQLHNAKILVVDDHVDLAEDLRVILEHEGATVTQAETARQAEALAAEQSFDVALVDIRLPDATGMSLLPRLKAIGGPHFEVLLISGNASFEDAIAAVQGGAYDYVLKPFDPDRLLTSVTRAVQQVALRRETELLAQALESSEESLRHLVDTVQALLLVVDEDGLVVRANQAVAAVTGMPAAELVGKDWFLTCVPDGSRRQEQIRFRQIMAGDDDDNETHEGFLSAARGGTALNDRRVMWRWSPHTNDDGSKNLYISGLDVTDQRALERRTLLSEKLAAVGTLSAGLAHEIRNPLNAASLQLQLLERRVKRISDDEKLHDPIDVVRNEIRRLGNLVGDFLSFARPAELRPGPVDLRELAERVVALEALHAQTLDVGLELIEGDTVTVLGDAERLKQVLLNLVRNALDAVSPGGRVELEVRRSGNGGASLIVRDDGPGIPEDNLDRIFEPFFSTKTDGTGLGMAICHSIISLHGGDIHIDCSRGTEIEVSLPDEPPVRPDKLQLSPPFAFG